MQEWVLRTPSSAAVSNNQMTLSYAELEDRVARCAAFLSDHGLADHDVCALDISDRLFFVICWLAVFRLGITSTAFDPDLPELRKSIVARKCGVGAVISDRDVKLADTRLIRADMTQVMAHPYDPDRPLRRGNSDYAMMIGGSGTTGSPKIIAVSFDAIIASAPTESEIWGLGPQDVTFTTVAPWLSSVPLRVYNALYRGGAFHIWSETNLNLFRALETAGVTKIFAAVLHVEKMIALATKLGRRLPNEAEVTIYASVVTDGLVRRVREHLTDRIRVVYGANELGVVADLDLQAEGRPPGSVGRVSKGTQVEIVDRDDRRLPAGAAGLVRARAPRLFSGYVGEPEETARALRNGWFYPGDVARLDPDGHLILLGRADQMMIFDGLNIHPAEIENVVSTHPAVTDVAVMPFKHESHQDVPICAVAIAPGVEITEAELKRFAWERLAERTPVRILILDTIPRNENGKVVRTELSARIREALERSRAG